MNSQQIIPTAIYLFLALAAGAFLVMILAAALHAETRYRGFILPAVFPIVAAGIAASVLLSGRNLAVVSLVGFGRGSSNPEFSVEASGAATWPLRLFTLYILATSFALIFGTWARRDKLRKPGIGLIVAFFGFFISNVALSSAFGTEPYFQINHFYPVVVFLAVFLCREQPAKHVILAGKIALLIVLVGSLIVLVVKRELVLQQPYMEGWIPILNVRLWGLASHANSIGPLALLYLLMEIHSPFKDRIIHFSTLVVALTVVVLAQSKTVWLVGIFLALMFYGFSGLQKGRIAFRSGTKDSKVIGVLIVVLICMALSLTLFLFGDGGKYVDKFDRSIAGQQLFSLSGRSQIWNVAIRVWEQNPMFGYGPRLWDPAFRQSIGMNFASHAHNQFLQSLSSAGTLGLLGTLCYLLTLGSYAFKLARQTAGFTLMLWIFLFIRCVTEIPLSTGTIFNGDFLTHLLIFAYFTRIAADSPMDARQFTNQVLPIFRSA